jgi:uncharacterized protein YndB with AHSA1/START domain
MYRSGIVSVVLLSFAFSQSVAAKTSIDSQASSQITDKVVKVEGVVDAPVAEVWRVFTTSEGAEEFFAQKANIELRLDGPYEIQFDPNDERSGTKGLKVLSYAPHEMISFQWNAPPELPEVRNGGTWVVVTMSPLNGRQTRVRIEHLGWKQGPEWDAAYVHFVEGWGGLMDRLKRRFSEGHPIDWGKEAMMYQKAKH